ncbi:MAG: ATP-binding cassette domain-containing protein [archaeon]|nr:ATP-binding cassette domain-containing protein [archaeon]
MVSNEINDLLTLKLLKEALPKINQLEGFDFHKFKAKFYMSQSYIEEAVSHVIEMWKLYKSPFQKLEYYLFRALIFHQSHKRERVQEFLKKFEKDINIIYTNNTITTTNLLIQYLELKIDLNTKDKMKRDIYIEKLLLKAPNIVRYQYELLELSYREKEEIRKNLYPLIEKYATVVQKPLERALKIRDILSSLFIIIEDKKNAKSQLESALEMIGEGIPNIRKSLEKRLSSLTTKCSKPENLLFVEANLILHSSIGKPKIKIFNANIERNETSYIITVKGKTTKYLKSEYYLVAQGGRSITKSDWEREQRIKSTHYSPKRKNAQSYVQAKIIEGNIEGTISVGRGELITLRGPQGSGKSGLINYLLGIEKPIKGDIIIDGTILGELEEKTIKEFRNNHLSLVVEGKVLLPKKIIKDLTEDFDITSFINEHPKEVSFAIFDLKNSLKHNDNFLSLCLRIFKLKPKLIVMNEPLTNIRGELLEKWFTVLNMLAKYHGIPILLETHHLKSSFYADCQYFIRDHKIIEIIESGAPREHENH